MRAEQYLMGYRTLLSQMAELEDRITEARITGKDTASMEAERERLRRSGEMKKKEILSFIAQVGDGEDARILRVRQALRLYYCQLLPWGEVRRLLRPLVLRKGAAETNLRRKPGISKTGMLRVREEALAAAEAALTAWE